MLHCLQVFINFAKQQTDLLEDELKAAQAMEGVIKNGVHSPPQTDAEDEGESSQTQSSYDSL